MSENDAPNKLDLIEETASIETHEIVTARVRINTSTTSVEESQTRVLQGTETDVRRVAIDRILGPDDDPPEPRTEGNTTIIPILKEVAIVETRFVLIEELHVTQRPTNETVEIPLSLRKQTATIERITPEDDVLKKGTRHDEPD